MYYDKIVLKKNFKKKLQILLNRKFKFSIITLFFSI